MPTLRHGVPTLRYGVLVINTGQIARASPVIGYSDI
jgi:hypothetical protein